MLGAKVSVYQPAWHNWPKASTKENAEIGASLAGFTPIELLCGHTNVASIDRRTLFACQKSQVVSKLPSSSLSVLSRMLSRHGKHNKKGVLYPVAPVAVWSFGLLSEV
jgi:hypothetical protein